jgi:hypothetical protein
MADNTSAELELLPNYCNISGFSAEIQIRVGLLCKLHVYYCPPAKQTLCISSSVYPYYAVCHNYGGTQKLDH